MHASLFSAHFFSTCWGFAQTMQDQMPFQPETLVTVAVLREIRNFDEDEFARFQAHRLAKVYIHICSITKSDGRDNESIPHSAWLHCDRVYSLGH